MFAALKWSFDCLAQGTWPTKSHSGGWAATGSSEAAAGKQPVRPRLAGTPLGFHGALLHVKGDWAEFAHTLGFADWNSELFCCLFCKATRANRYDIAGSLTTTWNGLVVGVNSGGPCLGQTMLGYEQTSTTTALVHSAEPSSLTCRSCNCWKTTVLSPIRGSWTLQCSTKSYSFLEAEFCSGESLENRSRHRNPIFDPNIGITLDSLMVDKLHTLHVERRWLGVATPCGRSFLWILGKPATWVQACTTCVSTTFGRRCGIGTETTSGRCQNKTSRRCIILH
jgi:hypothetical protein